LFFVFEKTKEEKYQKAIDLLRSQLLTHPRTASGSFWHKKRYPYQIWLDGLYVHAYDETSSMQWADKDTGHSPNIWSRSVGWLAMALVDIYELLGGDYKKEKVHLKTLANKLINGLKKHLDNELFMLYQIVDKLASKGNYLETSGSAMIAYSLKKRISVKCLY
jgi:unsaturated rhamnogalacturonyl hydrolase